MSEQVKEGLTDQQTRVLQALKNDLVEQLNRKTTGDLTYKVRLSDGNVTAGFRTLETKIK